jgi:hypothetical protein
MLDGSLNHDTGSQNTPNNCHWYITMALKKRENVKEKSVLWWFINKTHWLFDVFDSEKIQKY